MHTSGQPESAPPAARFPEPDGRPVKGQLGSGSSHQAQQHRRHAHTYPRPHRERHGRPPPPGERRPGREREERHGGEEGVPNRLWPAPSSGMTATAIVAKPPQARIDRPTGSVAARPRAVSTWQTPSSAAVMSHRCGMPLGQGSSSSPTGRPLGPGEGPPRGSTHRRAGRVWPRLTVGPTSAAASDGV